LRNKMLTAYFVSDQESAYFQSKDFSSILKFVQANPTSCRMKETANKLILQFKNIPNVLPALELLRKINEQESF